MFVLTETHGFPRLNSIHANRDLKLKCFIANIFHYSRVPDSSRHLCVFYSSVTGTENTTSRTQTELSQLQFYFANFKKTPNFWGLIKDQLLQLKMVLPALVSFSCAIIVRDKNRKLKANKIFFFIIKGI